MYGPKDELDKDNETDKDNESDDVYTNADRDEDAREEDADRDEAESEEANNSASFTDGDDS